jgi:uncharacterized C2H2 Zn-finger protein
MPKITRGFRWVKLSGTVALEHRGELISDIDRIKEIVLRCPKCGKRAVSYVLHKGQYYYLWHYARGQGKHMWCLGPRNPVTDEVVKDLKRPSERRSTLELTEEERLALYKVFVRKKKYTAEEARIAHDVLRRLLQ